MDDRFGIDNIKRFLADNPAGCDYLTGLANRRGLYRFCEELGDGVKLTAMYIDIDNFKRINDIYGHSRGDEFLTKVSEYIEEYVPGFVSRIGGDEFVALMDGDMDREEVAHIADELIKNMNSIQMRQDILSLLSMSIGIAMDQIYNGTPDDILSHCDSAMYTSKDGGKGTFTFYNEQDKTLSLARNIERNMKKGLADREFEVLFQPKVNMVTSEIVGAEALSRWIHGSDIYFPDTYIPVFERNGFISKLDMYIFEEACRLKSGWRNTIFGNLVISVNLSRAHIYEKDLPDRLCAIADRYGIPYEELELEVTESIFMKDSDELIAMTEKLQERGFLVSIDDFGSGFSALNLLKDLKVDTVKLAKEFLGKSSNTMRGRQVIRSIISMCRDLKINVVTEGVENREQVDFLIGCSCQVAQGYYYSRPLENDDFIRYASKHKSNILGAYHFDLSSPDFASEDGNLRMIYSGDRVIFKDGIFKGSRSVSFPGGDVERNLLELEPRAISNDSFTIAFWLYPEELAAWASAIYVKFETGFASFAPLAWEGHASYRIRDSREVNGWYDTATCYLDKGLWWHVVMTYNSYTEMARIYINGDPIAQSENVPTNRFVKRIMIGGDVFQPSIKARICELMIYNDPKDFDFIRDLYESYVNNPEFVGGRQRHLI